MALAEALREALSMDAGDREDSVAEARRWVAERYRWDAIAARYEGLYEQAIAGSPDRRQV